MISQPRFLDCHVAIMDICEPMHLEGGGKCCPPSVLHLVLDTGVKNVIGSNQEFHGSVNTQLHTPTTWNANDNC